MKGRKRYVHCIAIHRRQAQAPREENAQFVKERTRAQSVIDAGKEGGAVIEVRKIQFPESPCASGKEYSTESIQTENNEATRGLLRQQQFVMPMLETQPIDCTRTPKLKRRVGRGRNVPLCLIRSNIEASPMQDRMESSANCSPQYKTPNSWPAQQKNRFIIKRLLYHNTFSQRNKKYSTLDTIGELKERSAKLGIIFSDSLKGNSHFINRTPNNHINGKRKLSFFTHINQVRARLHQAHQRQLLVELQVLNQNDSH